jgi:malonyl-CoA O-methyltransferase
LDTNLMDVYLIDKACVRASFNRAAKTYDETAVLQKLVRSEMLNRLDLIKIDPQKILDTGCGTGHGSFALQKRFKKSQVISLDLAFDMLQRTKALRPILHKISGKNSLVCADIENLPITDASMSLVWSNLALQWCNDLDKSFSETMRVLQPNGLYIFSTFGPDTLKELRAATGSGNTHVSRFIDMHDIGDALTRAGFNAPVLDVEHYTLTYDNVKNVMLDLKAIGAHNATQGRGRGLAGKGFLTNLSMQYEQFRENGKLPATFEVIYGHAWKPANICSVDDFTPIKLLKRK